MRYRSVGWMVMGVWLGAWPLAAHADYMSNARASLKKGDLKSAQIDLRNAVRSDPQNAEAHYWLARVAFQLGDPVAAEREAEAARDRGFDPHQAVPVIAQAMLAQNKFQQLLDNLKPQGKDPQLDASILVFRGYALVGLRRPEDAKKAFAEAEQMAPNAVDPLLADARLAVARADLADAEAKIDRAIAAQPKSVEALLAKSQLLRLKNDGPGAMTVLDALITDQPGVMQARLDRASLELALQRNDAARNDIEVVLKATPGNIQGIYLLAVMEAQSKNYKAADADLQRISGFIGRIQRAYYLQAVIKEQLGQWEEAEDAAQKYLARAPNDLAAYKILARIQFSKHRPDQVIDTLSRVVDSGKADAETYDLLGRADALAGRAQDAVQNFQRAETLAPNDVSLQTRLASVRMGMGDVDAAMGDLEHTLQLAPKVPAVGEALFFAALATGDIAKTQDALAQVKAAEGDTDVVENLSGLLKLGQIDLPGAEAIFSALAKKSPDFTPAKINLARVLAMEGHAAQSEAVLNDLLAKKPAGNPALGMLGSIYIQTGRMPDAISLFERAHAAEPTDVRATVSLGDLYIRSNEPQKALDLAEAQKGQLASDTRILSLRAAAQLALGEKKEARATYSQLLSQDPNVLGARRELATLLVDSGDYESARNTITAGIAISPRNYQLYQDLALIELKATGIEAALATADRLISQDHDYKDLQALKGDIFMAANRPNDAIKALSEAQTAAPSSQLVTRLAGAYLRAGRPDDATKLLTDWTKAHGDDLVAKEQLSEIFIATNKLDDAQQYLQSILAQKPHDAIALNNLAWVDQQKGDTHAQNLARQAYLLSPGAQTADTLGWIMTTAGKADAGIDLLRQASLEAANDPRVQYHYAVALKDTGNKDEAIKRLTMVVGTKGEFKEKTAAQQLLDQLTKGS